MFDTGAPWFDAWLASAAGHPTDLHYAIMVLNHLPTEGVTLTELAEMMNCRFANWIIHFGTCSTLRKPNEVAYFVEQTRVSLVTGFTRDVDWIESSAFELLLFKAFLNYKSPKIICRHLVSKYPELAEATGFRFFPHMDVYGGLYEEKPLALAATRRRRRR